MVDGTAAQVLAVTSTSRFIGNVDYLNHRRREFEKRRADLQQTGSRSAHLAFHRIGGRFGRWSCDFIHRVSKAIVEEARQHGCTHIALEDLDQIRERISDQIEFQQWAFDTLQQQVEYKAAAFGIVVDTVNPSYTSQRCSKCGYTARRNRDGQQFECDECQYEQNADYNAAKNIARRLTVSLRVGQKSLQGGAFCQYALKSGAMIVNDELVASDIPVSAERELTGRSTISAVGN